MKVARDIQQVSWLMETYSLHEHAPTVVEQVFWALRMLASTGNTTDTILWQQNKVACRFCAEEAQKILLEFSSEPRVYELPVNAMRRFQRDNEVHERLQAASCGLLEALCSHGM